MIEIGPLLPADRAARERLARGYKRFYRTTVPDDGYEQTWQRLLSGPELHGIGARLNGQLIGIAHYLFRPPVGMMGQWAQRQPAPPQVGRGSGWPCLAAGSGPWCLCLAMAVSSC